jgi:hypothetical protein
VTQFGDKEGDKWMEEMRGEEKDKKGGCVVRANRCRVNVVKGSDR